MKREQSFSHEQSTISVFSQDQLKVLDSYTHGITSIASIAQELNTTESLIKSRKEKIIDLTEIKLDYYDDFDERKNSPILYAINYAIKKMH